jgi:apolipoprotein N-acyltransferase
LFASLPYLIDSFFSKKNNSFLATLIFPTAAVLMEFAYHQFNQYGTWGHFAYTQQSQYVLLQSISVLGMGYITFLITWFASVSNWIYEQRNAWRNVKKGVLIYGLVLSLTLIYGGYRVQFQKPNSETIRIASISALDSLKIGIDLQGLSNKETEDEVKIETRRNTSKLNQYLFERSIAEAQAGAKIVFWAEGNAVILKEDENELYEKASQIASEQNIYLGLGIAVVDPTNSKFLENKFVFFDKSGSKVMDYWKGISVPGVEAPISNNKSTGIQKVETEYGTIAGVICFDLDFPNYLKQAKGSDILLAPSNDWKEIDPIHTDMAKFRAIEQGFNFIRQTSFGLSIGTDYTGKVISEMDYFKDSSKVMITQLPTKGTKTIYSIIGDSFILFCFLLLILVITVIRKK